MRARPEAVVLSRIHRVLVRPNDRATVSDAAYRRRFFELTQRTLDSSLTGAERKSWSRG